MHSLVPGLFRMIEHVQLQSVSEDLARNEGADLQKLSTPGLGRKRKAEESSLYDGIPAWDSSQTSLRCSQGGHLSPAPK